MTPEAALCFPEAAKYLIISGNVPPFIYYTHLTALILSLLIGLFVYFKDRREQTSRILFWSLVPFLLWVFFNVMIWATNRSDLIMFLWSVQIMIEPLTYIGMLYLLYVFINKHDVRFRAKIITGIIYLPLILITPTIYSLEAFDISLCIPVESQIAYYTYVLELSSIIFIAIYATRRYLAEGSAAIRNQILYLTIGIIAFLLLFASGNIFGSLTDNWVTSQFGLFGTPIFAALISYLIVKYRIFDVKLIGAQALVVALWILIISILFLRTIENVRIVVALTGILLLILGIILVRSVRKEIEQREKIERLAVDLQKANDRLKELDKQKSEFVSFATHQLRSPLTAMKGYASLILEGDYGAVAPELKEVVERIYDSTKTLTNVVDDYLNISRIELGTMKYAFGPLDWKELTNSVIAELKPNIDKAGLKINFSPNQNESYMINADPDKFKQVIMNVIDNSVKYTKEGSISLSLEKKDGKIVFAVKDTGIGMDPAIIPKLFDKFIRASNANEANIRGTGLGLYVAKQIVLAHQGRIWAESEGEGKGSQFYVELPELKMNHLGAEPRGINPD